MIIKNFMILCLCIAAMTILAAFAEQQQPAEPVSEVIAADREDNRDLYFGILRVYMIEPMSRWNSCPSGGNDYAFLDIALDTDVVFDQPVDLVVNSIWDSEESAFDNIQPDNLKAIAILINAQNYGTGYSEPPDGHSFNIHPVDASAWATSTESMPNIAMEGFTHSVFAEDGSWAGSG